MQNSKIAFAVVTNILHPKLTHVSRIYLINPDGTGEKRLTQDDSFDIETSPAFSPDGTRIAFVGNKNGSSNIYLINVDGSNLVKLDNVVGVGPLWSPDGKSIMYGGYQPPVVPGTLHGIFRYDIAAKTIQLVIKDENDKSWIPVAWMPDGQQVVISLTQPTQPKGLNLYTTGFAGTQPQAVSNPENLHLMSLSYSRDGHQIAVCDYQRNQILLMRSLTEMSGFGTNLSNVTDSCDNFIPATAWSPDGNQIAYVVDNFDPYKDISTVRIDALDLQTKKVTTIKMVDLKITDTTLIGVAWGGQPPSAATPQATTQS